MVSIKNKITLGLIIYFISVVVFLFNPKAYIVLVSILCLMELNKMLRKLNRIEYLTIFISSILYISLAVFFYFRIYTKFGAFLLVFLSFITAFSDAFSYIAGTFFKRQQAKSQNKRGILKKIYNIMSWNPVSISPNKTLIGFVFAGIGGLSVVAIFIVLLKLMHHILLNTNNIRYMNSFFIPSCFTPMTGFILGLFGQAGDLIESYIKRKCKIKDSGSILAEHGGICDRYDSMYGIAYGSYIILVITGWI